MAETIYGTKGIWNPIIRGDNLTGDDFEEVRLQAGAIVGDFVTYDGQITAETPATHRDVKLAVTVGADAQVTNQLQGWCGQIIEPVITPDPVSGVAWDPSVALISGTLVRILKKGARATTAAVAVDTAAHDHLVGEYICIATAGAVKPVINTYTDTIDANTPTGPENAANLISLTSELVGRMSDVSEDISAESVVFIDWSGY